MGLLRRSSEYSDLESLRQAKNLREKIYFNQYFKSNLKYTQKTVIVITKSLNCLKMFKITIDWKRLIFLNVKCFFVLFCF